MAIKRILLLPLLLFIFFVLLPPRIYVSPILEEGAAHKGEVEGELISEYDREGHMTVYSIEEVIASGTNTVRRTIKLPNSATFSSGPTAGNTYKCSIGYNESILTPVSASCTKTGDSPTDPDRPVPDPVTPTPTPTPATDTTPKTDSKALEATIGSSASNPLPEILKTKDCPDTGIYESGILKGLTCKGATQGSTGLVQTVLVIRNLINGFLLPLAGSVFVLMFVAGGVLYITAGGDEKRAELAKKTLTAAVIGLVISALAYVIIGVFASILGGGIAQ